MKWLRRGVVAAALTAALLSGVVHTRAGRALLGGDSACPWGGAAPSAEKLESFRRTTAAALKEGTARAASKPAHGFALDRSTREDVRAWMASRSITCEEELGGAALRCALAAASKGDGASSYPSSQDLFFRFDPKGIIVGLDVMHDGVTREQAASLLSALGERIEREAGPSSRRTGAADAARLGSYLGRASLEFRFADYAADVSATNFGARGVVVREQYRSIPN